MTDVPGPESADALSRIEHVVVAFAEECSVGDRPGLLARATECRAYHGTPRDEDRRAWWAAYAEALAGGGYPVSRDPAVDALVGDLSTGDLADVTVLDVDAAGLDVVLGTLAETLDPATLVAVALGDEETRTPAHGSLGPRGRLLLFSRWSPGAWVSEEVFDHSSLLLFCERWTAARGREVRAAVPAARRQLVGDLVGALTLRPAPLELTADQGSRRLTRPLPYFPTVELRQDDGGVVLLLANVGPTATRAVPLVVDDGTVSHHLVAGSSSDGPSWTEVPVDLRDGRYDVTVLGPDHFRRRFAGPHPGPVSCTCEHFGAGDPWFPDLVLTLSHTTTVPVFFWLERGIGTRFGGVRSERLIGPRRTATFREQPGARTHGWYDLRVTTSADQGWAQEYAGHLHTGHRPSLTR